MQLAARVGPGLMVGMAAVAAVGLGAVTLPAWVTCAAFLPDTPAVISAESRVIYLALLAVCAAIAAVVFAVLCHSIASFRESSEGEQNCVPKPHKVRELVWALTAIAIMLATAVPSVVAFAERAPTVVGAAGKTTSIAVECHMRRGAIR